MLLLPGSEVNRFASLSPDRWRGGAQDHSNLEAAYAEAVEGYEHHSLAKRRQLVFDHVAGEVVR
jgi:hypothetical protein